MVKDINPETMEKDPLAKNAAWTPAGKSDGFKTFNRLATAYQPATSTSIKFKKDEKRSNSVWA